MQHNILNTYIYTKESYSLSTKPIIEANHLFLNSLILQLQTWNFTCAFEAQEAESLMLTR